MTNRRIVITGMGALTPLGNSVAETWDGMKNGRSGIGKIESIGNDKYNTSIYATVSPFADIGNLRQVMVITEFEGQGSVLESTGE